MVKLALGQQMGKRLVRQVDLARVIPYQVEANHLLVRPASFQSCGQAEKIEQISNVDEVGLSIDGREDTHDALRGRGAFRELKRAIAARRGQGITVVLTYTMVAQNIGDLDFVIEFARQQGVLVTVNVAHGRIAVARELPVNRSDNTAYRRALKKIVDYQARGYPVFRARRTLELMQRWENYQDDTSDAAPARGFPRCLFGSYGATLYSDGRLTPCFLNVRGGGGISAPERGFSAAWKHCQGWRTARIATFPASSSTTPYSLCRRRSFTTPG
jgi:MoaA/NifB/PqqE/SkfB family radical SAM enzyme